MEKHNVECEHPVSVRTVMEKHQIFKMPICIQKG